MFALLSINNFATLLYPEFTAYTTVGNPGIDVRTVDVDYDGKDEIVGLSEGAF